MTSLDKLKPAGNNLGGALRSDNILGYPRVGVVRYDLTAECTCYSLFFKNSDRPSMMIVPRPPVAS